MQHNLFSVTALRRDSGKQLHKDMLGDNCDVMVIRRDGSEYCFAVADKSDGLFWIRASDPGGPGGPGGPGDVHHEGGSSSASTGGRAQGAAARAASGGSAGEHVSTLLASSQRQ
jgi:hypothetical protein